MRTRTLLTTPPGEEPAADEPVRARDPERYSPGLALPTEPRIPGRFRRVLVTAVALVLLGAAAYGAFRLVTSGQFQDPALTDQAPVESPAAGDGAGSELPDGGDG